MAMAFDRRKLKEAVTRKDGNITEPPDDASFHTEDAPGEEPASITGAHGPAQEVHMTFGPEGTHVTTTHADGFTHESNHLDKERGFEHARVTSGLDNDAPDMTDYHRERSAPTGPKDKERMDKENKGMKHGRSTQDGSIPGYEER